MTPQPPPAPPITVLLVEDDRDLRTVLTHALRFYGQFTVIEAVDGIDGLEQAIAIHPNCMVIDAKMPGLDGFQLVRALRGDRETASIPLIILTALAQDHARFTGLASGADRFLQKPIKPQLLVQIIHEILTADEQQRTEAMTRLAEAQGVEPHE